MENRNCQNCKNDFTIEPDDFSFYEKIKVPPPTFCPECRLIRKLVWRNERSLYKRKCDLCKNNIISMYQADVAFPVYCSPCWKSDAWDPFAYGKDYDFTKSFFEQFKELFYKVPRQALWQFGNNVNVEYANFTQDVKNVYLSYSIVWGSEDVCYSKNIDNNAKQVVDSYNISNSEKIYESIGLSKCYKCKYVFWSSDCIDCSFMLDCVNCQDCVGCVNLRNKRYCIENIQYSKEEYQKIVNDLKIDTYLGIQEFQKVFWEFSLKFPHKYSRIVNGVSCSGDEIRNCKNVKESFTCYDGENIKYGYRCARTKDSMDCTHTGTVELAYEHAFGGSDNSSNISFIIGGALGLTNATYCDYCQSSSDIFGCIGLHGSQYCVLNKKYSKESFENLKMKIIEQMNTIPYTDKNGCEYKYGEFFPFELSPFGYNETLADEVFPLNNEEIIQKGYNWKDKIDNKYEITIQAQNLPNSISETDDSILNDVIECEESKKAFKLIPYELQFYKQMNIPVPHIHPDIRYKHRISKRNPLKLWHRSCMNEGCNNEFETPYAPDRPEKVYCEKCYQKEVL